MLHIKQVRPFCTPGLGSGAILAYRRQFSFLSLSLLMGIGLLCSCNRAEQSAKRSEPSASAVTANDVAAANLGVDDQKYIWDIEHTAFELEAKFGKALLAALKKREPDGLARFFRDGLKAHVLDRSHRAVIDRGFLKEDTTLATEPAPLACDSNELVQFLIGYLDGFEKVQSAKFRVLSLDAQDREPKSGLWSLTVLLAGTGRGSGDSLVEFESHHRLTCQFADDAAIEEGRIVTGWTVVDERRRSGPRPLFQEVTNAVGLHKVDIQDNWSCKTDAVRQYHTQMAVEDFDRDGFWDVAVASHNGRWRLLRSEAGQKFTEVSSEVGLPMWVDEAPRSRATRNEIYLAAWIDFDNDAFPDLVLGDRLFRNVEGRQFQDVTESSRLTFAYNPRGCVVADYDADGLLDLYVLYQNRRDQEPRGTAGWVMDSESGAENQLWRNTGDGKFENVTEKALAGGGRRQTFAASWMFANQDHLPDLYIANDFGMNVLLLNQGNGTFQDASDNSGAAGYATSMGVATGDLTGDGDPEIYVANMFSKMGRRIIAHVGPEKYPAGVFDQIRGSCAGNTLYTRSGPDEKFQEISEPFEVNQVGWAYAPALADFDADGFLDIYATCGFLSFQRNKPDG